MIRGGIARRAAACPARRATVAQAWWAAGLTLVLAVAASAADRRPNVVLVFGDDLGRHAGIYARLDARPTPDRLLSTPHIDRLANEGAVVRNAFVSAPSCTPSRSALVSGAHFWRAGRAAILSGAVWDGSVFSLPLALQARGYHIGETYKVWSPGTPKDAPFLDGTPGGHAYEQAGHRFNKFSTEASALVAAGMSPEAARQELLGEIRGNLAAFLADRPEGRPFFYFLGPTNTHRRWARGSGSRLWGLVPEQLAGIMPPFLPDVPEVREDLADYLGEVQAVDAAIGEVVARLRESGDLARTIIIVSGDHGAPGFPHGKCDCYDFGTRVPLVVWAGPESGLRIRPGTVVEELVSLTDVAPTILEAAGEPRPTSMTGRSLVPLLAEHAAGSWEPREGVFFGRERHFGRARAGSLPYPVRAVRTKDHLYVRNFAPDRWPMGTPRGITADRAPDASALATDTSVTLSDFDASPTKAWLVAHRDDAAGRAHYERAFGRRPAEELYVLATDPDQVENRAADPALAPVRERLATLLTEELERTGDPRVVDGGRFFETPPMAGASDDKAAGGADAAPAARAAERPSVLLVMCDDLRCGLGCYAEPGAITPHIDRLAARGVRFDKAYCQYPLCNPSRASMLTGRRPAHTGVWNNAVHFRDVDPAIVTLPQAFRQAGWRTERIGKLYHYGVPKQIGTSGLDDPPSWDAVFNPKGRDVADQKQIFSLVPGSFGGVVSWLAADGTDAEQTDGIGAARAVARLEEFAKTDGPFFLAVGFYRPHTPYVAPKSWFAQHPREAIEPPLVPAGHDAAVPAAALDTRRPEQERLVGDLAREAIQAYRASVSFVDAQVGIVLDALERLRLDERTLVVFASDHGYHLGEHGLWQKRSLFEESARVPLILAGPGCGRGLVRSVPVELIDVMPTLCASAGLPLPAGADGRDLACWLTDEPAAVAARAGFGDRAITEVDVGKEGRGTSLRTGRWRYTLWNGGAAGRQLYDHDDDPAEMVNLADRPDHADVQRALEEQLRPFVTLREPRPAGAGRDR